MEPPARMYIGDWLARREMLTPNQIALLDATDGCRPITYREWNGMANRTAAFMRERCDVVRGERVAVLAKNSTAYLDVWFACGKLGAVLQNLNWRLTATELAALVLDASPRVLIYGPEFIEVVRQLRGNDTTVEHYIALDDSQCLPGDGYIGEREHFPPTQLPPIELEWDDPWVICYTGGTTGLPKGAILTHGNIAWNSINTVLSWGLTADDVALLNAPLFHTGGLNVFTAPLVHLGGTSIVCRDFNVDQVFDLIRDHGVTLLFGVPTMFIAMQQHPRWQEADFARLKLIISGGAPCPMPVFEKFWERGLDFKTGYGLTEAGPNTFWLPEADIRRKPGAVGFPLFHIDLSIINEAGDECAPDEVGQLLIRGPHVTPGYWNQPEATAEAIVNGWLHTGDLARRDLEGYYTIVGRQKDLIISGGENVYPAEVENVLAGHPAVGQVALIGVSDELWGEVGWAVVVPTGAPPAVEELTSYAGQRLARYKVPKRIVFRDALPMTGAGKVDRKRLQEEIVSAGREAGPV